MAKMISLALTFVVTVDDKLLLLALPNFPELIALNRLLCCPWLSIISPALTLARILSPDEGPPPIIPPLANLGSVATVSYTHLTLPTT